MPKIFAPDAFVIIKLGIQRSNHMLTRIFFLVLSIVFMMNISVDSQTTFPVENGVSLALAKWRGANYSDVRYKLNITLEKGAPLMKGNMEVRVTLTAEGAKNDLVMDWRTTQFKNDRDKPFANITEVNGTKNPPIVELNEHLKVPRSFLKAGENIIKIDFASPIKTSGAAITRYTDREDSGEYIYSLFVPSDASTAFPCFDQPDLKARFKLHLNTPGKWRAVSNTRIESQLSIVEGSGLRGKPQAISEPLLETIEFAETKPISTYVFAFAAGDFAKFNESDPASPVGSDHDQIIPPATTAGNEIYVRRSQAEKFKQHAAEVFRLNREGLKFLASYFDYPYPFPKYDLVLIPEFPFGGMEHAGATFVREDSIIFPQEPTANNYISRANVLFHEAAHQWFGDTVTMRWFDDLWLKEGFAEFMAYKTLEKVMPEYNAWKVFYERNKQSAYLTDSTRGTTAIYQPIENLSAAKSAYGNIVYRKAPSFLRQAEFYLGPDRFQTAVRAFLKKHEFANAGWQDLVDEFNNVALLNEDDPTYSALSPADKKDMERIYKESIRSWANSWVKNPGMEIFSVTEADDKSGGESFIFKIRNSFNRKTFNPQKFNGLIISKNGDKETRLFRVESNPSRLQFQIPSDKKEDLAYFFPNYQDYGYGTFLMDEKSRAYVLENIQNEKDDFLRAMMWGSLWDSVREGELSPKDYVELVIKDLDAEKDDVTVSTLLGRVSTAMNYYLSEKQQAELAPRVEELLIEKLKNSAPAGQRLTYYRSFLGIASTERARGFLKHVLKGELSANDFAAAGNPATMPPTMPANFAVEQLPLKTKDKFDIAIRLVILGDKDAPALLAELEKTETSDEAKRYAYAAKAGFATAENKAKYFNDFLTNKEISESWIEAAMGPFNSVRHANLTQQYLERALAELPNLKRNRKIFFVNGWLGAFIGGQKDEKAMQTINKFLADNPNLDKDLRLKVLENADIIDRAVKIRAKYAK
jgi:aminopeptidase N